MSDDPTPRAGFGAGALLIAALLGAALSGGAVLLATRGHDGAPSAEHAPAPAAEVWQCPMHPAVVRDGPGTCPICGMDLVKLDAAPTLAASAAAPDVPGLAPVQIDATRQQLIGLRTSEVTRGLVGGAWRAAGKVAIDETRVFHVNVKVGGFVEEVFVDFVGKPVRKGQPVFSIYSPELYSAQQEYLLALDTQRRLAEAGGLAQNGEALVAAARRRLELWDIPASEIERLEQTHEPRRALSLVSPISGVVVKKDVVEGMRLEAGTMPYEIVDLSSVWVLADVYERDLRFIAEGMGATLTLTALPGRSFEGEVAFVDPLLDPLTRTVKVRLSFPNPSGELRPEMFGELTLRGAAREALRVSSDALVQSGTRTVVFVDLGEGRFAPREIQVGERDGDQVEVVSGLSAGERVVSRANFLVDSESSLKASLAGMGAPEAASHGDHGDHGSP